MRYYLRLASAAVWTGGANIDVERARATFKLREGEEGLSLWEIRDHTDSDLVLAACACQRRRIEKIDHLAIDAGLIEELGPVATIDGGSPVAGANALHRELRWSQGVCAGRPADARLLERLKQVPRLDLEVAVDELGRELARHDVEDRRFAA